MKIKEHCRKVKGYDNYQVSDLGNIRKKECVLMIGGFPRKHKMKKLVAVSNGFGYVRVSLSKNRKSKGFYIHRLVATAFIKKTKIYQLIIRKNERTY